MPFPETFREHEAEVRSPMPTPIQLMVGVIPSHHSLFPAELRRGYAGDKLRGGQLIQKLSGNLKQNGRLVTNEDKPMLQPLIDQLVIE